MKKRLQFLLLAVSLGTSGLVRAQTPVALTAATERVPLASHLTFWRDASGTMTLAQAQAAAGAEQFTPNQTENIYFGFTGDAIWVHFVLQSQVDVHSKWFVELAHPRFEEIDWYAVRTGGAVEHVADGNRFLRAAGAVHTLYPAKSFELAPGETAEIYLRLKTPMQFLVPLTVFSPEAFGEQAGQNGTFSIICLAAFMVLFAMGLIFALAVRDRGYLFYAASLGFMALNFVGMMGYWRFWEWPWWRFATTNGRLGLNGFANIALMFYLRWFFDLPATMPRVDRSVRWLAWSFVGLSLWLMTSGPYLPRLVAMQVLDIVAGVLAVVIAIAAWMKGNRTARFYLLAWGSFWGMFLAEILQEWKALPIGSVPNVLLMIGLLLAFTLFQAAMADRVRQMQKDKENAQAQAEKIAREAAVREETERELREILEKIPTAVRVSFLRREDVFINEQFVRLFGYRSDEIQTQEDWFRRAYPDEIYRTQIREEWNALLTASPRVESEGRELRIICKGGAVRNVMVSITLARDMLLTSFVDVTERLRLENDLRATQTKLQAMLEAMPDMLFRVDRERRISEYYSAPSNLPYVSPAGFLGKRVDEVMPEAVTRIFIAALNEAAVKGTHHGAIYSLPMTSGICWFELSIAVMGTRLEPVTDFIILVRDITRRKRAEDDALARSAELEQAKDAAERANRAKGLFLANMSHEIRTPLSALVGLSQAMCKQAEKRQLPADFTRMLEQIRSGGRYLNLMLTNLLDVSAIESGRPRVHLRPVKLDEWAQSVCDILEPIAVTRQIDLRWHAQALAGAERCTDPVRLTQILINLVHNAIKFTPAGKGVDVRFERRPDFFALEVADEGPGLPTEQTAVFSAYADGIPAISDLDHGVGLGLYVVQTNAQLLGGRVDVATGSGGGACFRVEWGAQESEV